MEYIFSFKSFIDDHYTIIQFNYFIYYIYIYLFFQRLFVSRFVFVKVNTNTKIMNPSERFSVLVSVSVSYTQN